MRRTELISRIRKAAKSASKPFGMDRHGGEHDVWKVGGKEFPIPRHREIGQKLVIAIMKELEGELGRRWWSK